MSLQTAEKRYKIEPFLGGLALLLILMGCFFILQPFITALLWAMILAYSLYPLQRNFTRWFRGSRTLAAIFVTLTMTVLLAGPVVLIGFSIVQDGKDLTEATRKWFLAAPDQAPSWVAQTPVVGEKMAEYWAKFAEDRKPWIEQLEKKMAVPPRPKIVMEEGGTQVIREAPPLAQATADPELASEEEKKREMPHMVILLGQFLFWAKSGLLAIALALTKGVTQVVMSAFLAFFLLRDANILADRLSVGVERLAGSRGQHLLKVAGNTVRGVVFGILGTAIVQALVAGLGFWISGVPGAVLLSVLTFFFAVIPFGPPMIWLPVAFWLFLQKEPGMGIFMLLWGTFAISMVDNILRPFLISQGSKMPFVLIFCGVIGGALAFGLVGVFMGPTLLAVAFRMIEEWSSKPDLTAIIDDAGMLNEVEIDSQIHGGKSIGAR